MMSAGIHTKKPARRLNLTLKRWMSDADRLYLLGRNFPPRHAERVIKIDFSQEGLSLLN